MRSLKFTLALIVVATIGAGIFFWIQTIKEPEKVKAPESAFTKKVEGEIERLKVKPDNKFCRDYYNEVAYHINEFYKQNRLGKNQSENDLWKENLESNLYSAYAEKFIKQAKTVFRGSEWKPEDLKFIQAEKNELKKSKLLVAGSPVDRDFTTIQTALNMYNEIVSFISSCKGYCCSKTGMLDHFPIAEVKNNIQRAASLRSHHLENEYVNNCFRLHYGLKEIPSMLFSVHVRYLDTKIDYWSNMWCNYSSHKDYSNNLNIPLKNEINDLSNSTIYSVINVDGECTRLFNKWSADNQKAYKATYPCHN